MASAPASATQPAASAIFAGSLPMTCTLSGTPGLLITSLSRFLRVTGELLMRTNSVHTTPTPPSSAKIVRSSGCVTPSIGASIVPLFHGSRPKTGTIAP